MAVRTLRTVTKYPDGRIEVDLTEEEVMKLLTAQPQILHRAIVSTTNIQIPAANSSQQKESKVVNKKFPQKDWTLLSETLGERRGATEHAHFYLYQEKATKMLAGLVKSQKQSRVFYLGRPYNAESPISQFMRRVETLPLNEPFTRKQLVEILPATLARSEVLKLSLEYLKHLNMIKEEIGRQIGTGAKKWIRLNEKVDGPTQQSGKDVAGTILR